MKKMYLIGNLKSYKQITPNVRRKLYFTQIEMMKLGFEVYNPCENDSLVGKSKSHILRENLKRLIQCESVYIMPDVDIKNNLEVKLANDLNLIVIQGLYIPIGS